MNFVSGNADQWWKLSKRFEKALDRVSDDLDSEHGRNLKLGSPVLVGQPQGDIIRVPVIMRGGPRELPVAYLHIQSHAVNGARVEAIARRAAVMAQAVIASGMAGVGADTILNYP